MTKIEFLEFCDTEFRKYGFFKAKKTYFKVGDDLLCGLDLQRSNYGTIYYVNYFYCIGKYDITTELPSYYDKDISGRILAMSKTQTYQGKHFLTAMIEYEEYSEDELREFFNEEFKSKILPPIVLGKRYILENLKKLYSLDINRDEVIQKLQE